MASMQMQAAISDNDKAILEELMTKEEVGNKDSQKRLNTYGLMKNKSTETLTLCDTKSWSGCVIKPYPLRLDPGQDVTFLHAGVLPDGSKGGFVYAELNNGWKRLVAYHTPANKVIVSAGYTIAPWDEVEKRLDRYGSSSSEVPHGVRAEIENGILHVTFGTR